MNHTAAQKALRTQLLTLEVVTTGTTTLGADASGYTRSSGSFVTDGFAIGMEVTPGGFTETEVGIVTAVSALALTIDGGRTVETATAGRSLSVGVPAARGWENVALTPVSGEPYIEEQYNPAASVLLGGPADGGTMEHTGLYVLRWYSRDNTGLAALTAAADALLTLFKPGTTLAIDATDTLRVRGDIGPWRGPIMVEASGEGGAHAGWAVVVVTIPWRVYSTN
jgi:hypothetical protein